MHTRIKQAAAALLALTAGLVGGWAEFAPLSFYRSFPLAGHPWISPLGPYNEHLARDVGGLYLALLVVTGWAVIRPHIGTLRLTGAGWLAFSLPHLVFHLLHLDELGTADKIGNIVSLAANVALALVLIWPAPAGADRQARPAEAGRDTAGRPVPGRTVPGGAVAAPGAGREAGQ
jgi:hypothetical protein